MSRIYNRRGEQDSMSALLSGGDEATNANKRNALANVEINNNRILGQVDGNYPPRSNRAALPPRHPSVGYQDNFRP